MTADKLAVGTATVIHDDPDYEWEFRIGFESLEAYKGFESLLKSEGWPLDNTLLTDRITTNPAKRYREELEERRGVDEALAEVKKVLTKLTRRK